MDLLTRIQTAFAGRYSIERELGRGGMAVVFLARDNRVERTVAIKVLKPEIAASLGSDRFLLEIQIAGRLHHPNIVGIHDSGQVDGLLYYVMPFVDGESLAVRLRRETQLPVEDALEITREVADALAYSHTQGAVHRDIKPENILLASSHAWVADFGVALALSAARGKLTDPGIALGTPEYMSPEQAVGSDQVDARSDVYSLGCVLYEMLAGEPPFTGHNAQVVLARQVSERPTPLELVRPGISPELVHIVSKSLAKTPADRFRDAETFRNAIRSFESGTYPRILPPGAVAPWVKIVAAMVVVIFGALVGHSITQANKVPLDPNHIIAFPLVVSGADEEDEGRSVVIGQDVAYLIVAALDGRTTLTWQNGLDLITEERHLLTPYLLTGAEKRDRARQEGAAYYIDGRIMLTEDSTRVHLNLRSVDGGAIIARSDTVGIRADTRQLGVLGIGPLLLSLLPPGDSVDVSAVSGRSAGAIQTFVQAERHFHAGRFQTAFDQYRSAVEQDSAFALAALRAAQAAAWSDRSSEATGLIGVAQRHEGLLVPRDVQIARGFADFLAGKADSAVQHFRRALALDAGSAEALMGIGEVFTHLLPSESPQDSLAEAAFLSAFEKSGAFAPVLYHLIEVAVRRGELPRAETLAAELRAGRADPLATEMLALMIRCVRNLPDAIDWRGAVAADPRVVYNAAFSLTVGGHQPECARAAWGAVLAYDSTPNHRFSALIGMQSLLVATGSYDEVVALLDSAAAESPTLGGFYLFDSFVAPELDVKAATAAERLGFRPEQLAEVTGEPRLGFLAAYGAWQASHGDVATARAVRDHLTGRAARTPDRHLTLMAGIVTAHVALAEGDTAAARQQFAELTPTAGRGGLAWRPWESLGSERLALAELLLDAGELDRAMRVAASFDSPSAAPLLIYLPSSLALRLRIASIRGDRGAVTHYRDRLRTLGRDDLIERGELRKTS